MSLGGAKSFWGVRTLIKSVYDLKHKVNKEKYHYVIKRVNDKCLSCFK